ncbi:MAG: nitroreductase family deazaflavin-dependent oxidoreductase [Acidobacteria bacterium]|nr:nitroreductase family deazaflavin-dependent oxidoreductase [Acidobacteriota bacterium]
MLLEHRGRTSSRRRFAVLEVVDRPAPDRVIVASGFGRSAQWSRNLEANGVAYVTVRRLRARRAVATLLNEEDSQRHLIAYGGATSFAMAPPSRSHGDRPREGEPRHADRRARPCRALAAIGWNRRAR